MDRAYYAEVSLETLSFVCSDTKRVRTCSTRRLDDTGRMMSAFSRMLSLRKDTYGALKAAARSMAELDFGASFSVLHEEQGVSLLSSPLSWAVHWSHSHPHTHSLSPSLPPSLPPSVPPLPPIFSLFSPGPHPTEFRIAQTQNRLPFQIQQGPMRVRGLTVGQAQHPPITAAGAAAAAAAVVAAVQWEEEERVQQEDVVRRWEEEEREGEEEQTTEAPAGDAKGAASRRIVAREVGGT